MYKAKSTTLLAVSARSPDLLLLPFLASFGCACVVPPSSACAFGGSSSSSTGALCPDGPNPQFSTIKGFISIDCQCCAFRNCGFQARICWISINGFRASSWRRNKQAERRGRKEGSLAQASAAWADAGAPGVFSWYHSDPKSIDSGVEGSDGSIPGLVACGCPRFPAIESNMCRIRRGPYSQHDS